MSNNGTQQDPIVHWSNFGQRGRPSDTRVRNTQWKTGSFVKPVTASWSQLVSASDVPKIINGYLPGQMEDKWFVYTEGPDTSGLVNVHMHRSWTGKKMFQIEMRVETTEDFKFADKDAKLSAITFETEHRDFPEEEAKSMAMEVLHWCMDVKVPSSST